MHARPTPAGRLPASVTRTGSFVFLPPVDGPGPIPAPPARPIPPLGPLAASTPPFDRQAVSVQVPVPAPGRSESAFDGWPASARGHAETPQGLDEVDRLLGSSPAADKKGSGLEIDDSHLRDGRGDGGMPAVPPILAQVPDFEAPGWAPLWSASAPQPAVSSGTARPPGSGALGPGPGGRSPSGSPARPVAPGRGETARGAAPSATGVPTNRSNLLAGLLIAGLVGGGIVLLTRMGGGVSPEIEQALGQAGQLYMPSLTATDAEGGSLDATEHVQLSENLRAGRCYGWIATAQESPFCNLDLHLASAGRPLMTDTLLDNVPVVFHCPEQDGPVELTLSNAGTDSCPYGLGRFEAVGSLGWPLEPYLRLYADYIGALRGSRYTPAGDVLHGGPLQVLGRDTYQVEVPRGRCRTVLAVAQQGNDLDMTMTVNGMVVQEDTAFDNFPIVGYCAPPGEDVRAEVQVYMYTGYGPYVWQVLEGPPL